MAWSNSGTCPCTWDAGAGSINCDAQTPGADRVIVPICRDKIESITVTAADDTNPEDTNIITAITLKDGEQGYPITAKADTINLQSGESINDNGGKDRNEVITGQGTISTEYFNYLQNRIGKEVVVVVCDNDEVLWAFGHSGGMKLNDWNADWGTTQGDNKAITFNFTNTSKPVAMEIRVADVAAFFTQITSPAV